MMNSNLIYFTVQLSSKCGNYKIFNYKNYLTTHPWEIILSKRYSTKFSHNSGTSLWLTVVYIKPLLWAVLLILLRIPHLTYQHKLYRQGGNKSFTKVSVCVRQTSKDITDIFHAIFPNHKRKQKSNRQMKL